MLLLATHVMDESLSLGARMVTLPGREPFRTWANDDLADARVDEDLKQLIFGCMAMREHDRPSLGVILDACENAVATRGEAYYSTDDVLAPYETDVNISSFVRAVVLDALDEEDGDVEMEDVDVM